MDQVDVAIVGAGPTGLFAAYYAGFRGLSTVLIDALPEPGGQVTAMYPEKQMCDIAGFPVFRGRDLVHNLVEQAQPYGPEYLLGVQASTLAYREDRPVVGLSDGTSLHCGAVLVTGGLGSFTARPLPAADEFPGTGIVYLVPHLDGLNGHQPAPGVRGRRHRRVPGQGTTDRGRLRRGGHRRQQRRDRHRPVGAPVPGSLLRQRVAVEVHDRVAGQLLQPVVRVDDPDRAALGAHDDRLGVRPARPVPDPAQQVTGGDPGRDEEAVG